MPDEKGTVNRTRAHTWVQRAAIMFFATVFAAMMWPIYPLFGGIFPMMLGMPLSLFYQAILLVLSFLGLIVLYRWERRNGEFS